jgi:uncharacterized repeat protein (TIGR01451 family)
MRAISGRFDMTNILALPLHFRAAVAALTSSFIAGAALAGPYDGFDNRPGTVITNEVSATYGPTPGSHPEVTAEVSFTVGTIETPATLEAYHYAPGNPSAETYTLSPTAFSTSGTETGPFALSPPARSDGQVIDTSSPLPLAPATRILRGETVFLLLDNQGMNIDDTQRDTIILSLGDTATGDAEVLQLTETGPDTGIFGGYINTAGGGTSQPDGGLLTAPLSQIDATFTDPWRSSRQLFDFVMVGPVDPFGVFFDSQTGAPIDGVTITVIDTATGNPATVYGDDLSASYPSTVVSGGTATDSSGAMYDFAPGQYRFPYVDVGTYRFEVTPPAGYQAPTARTDADLQNLPGAPYALKDGSRLEDFEVQAGPPIQIDIPLDGAAILDITRDGSVDKAGFGDIVSYTVSIGSSLAADLTADVIDFLPSGLSYVPQTVRVDGTLLDTPEISVDGQSIIFNDIDIPQGDRAEITYLARVGAGASEGDTLSSSSRAQSASHLSNTATHDLKILDTFAQADDIVVGQIFPTGCEAKHDPALDLSGIRVYAETGRYAVTDKNGRYSFRALPKGTHVLAIDELSLPAGATAVLCDNNTLKAGSALSQFVKVQGGLLRQADFYLTFDTEEEVDARLLRREHSSIADFGATWFQNRSPQVGMAFPPNGYLPSGPSLDASVVRSEGQTSELFINGAPVAAVHKRSSVHHNKSPLVLDVWRGANLNPGHHQVRAVIKDATGKVIYDESRRVSLAGDLTQIEVVTELSQLQSDGRSEPRVTFRMLDAQGIPVRPGAQATLSVKAPFAFSKQSQRGNTVLSEGEALQRATATVDGQGYTSFTLAAPRTPGTAEFTLTSKSGTLTTEADIALVERPWVVIGIAESSAAHDAISSHVTAPGFKDLGSLGSLTLSGRVALYAEGVIDGKWLTTLRYDSSIDPDLRDFFDVDPNARYIVYGDKSVERDAAQSRHPLYLRLQGPDADFLYGDYDPQINAGVVQYSRRLTGARAIYEKDGISVLSFAASTSQQLAEDSFPANGTSGPFYLENRNVVRYSERLEVVTTDRDAPSREIEKVTLRRGQDYDIDYTTGRIFLSEPLSSRDAGGNPNSLVVAYEISEGGTDGMIVGGRVEYDTSPDTTLALTAVHEGNIQATNADGRLIGADIRHQFAPDLTGTMSLAQSRQRNLSGAESARSGYAAEATLEMDTEKGQVSAFVRAEDQHFGIDQTAESGDRIVSAGLTADILLEGDEWTDEDGVSHKRERRLEADITAERNLNNGHREIVSDAMLVKIQDDVERGVGLRVIDAVAPTTPGKTGQALKIKGRSKFTTYDGALDLSMGQEVTLLKTDGFNDPDMGILEATWRASEKLTLKLSNEHAISDGGISNIFALGAEVAAWEGATIRFGGLAASNQKDRAILGYAGIDQQFDILSNTSLTLSFDGQNNIDGLSSRTSPSLEAGLSHPRLSEAYTSYGAYVDHTGDIWNAGAGVEHRSGEIADTLLISMRADRSLNEELAIGAKASFYAETPEGEETKYEHEVEASTAYRPFDARFALLDQISIRYDAEPQQQSFTAMNSIYYSHQYAAGHQLNLRHAIKYTSAEIGADSASDLLNLVGSEYRHKINDWLDVGAQGSIMHSAKTHDVARSYGASIGLTPFDNAWISMGYNVEGFEDADFSEGGHTDEGLFVQFRMKIDAKSAREILRD